MYGCGGAVSPANLTYGQRTGRLRYFFRLPSVGSSEQSLRTCSCIMIPVCVSECVSHSVCVCVWIPTSAGAIFGCAVCAACSAATRAYICFFLHVCIRSVFGWICCLNLRAPTFECCNTRSQTTARNHRMVLLVFKPMKWKNTTNN